MKLYLTYVRIPNGNDNSENFWLLGRAKFFGIAEWYVGLCDQGVIKWQKQVERIRISVGSVIFIIKNLKMQCVC